MFLTAHISFLTRIASTLLASAASSCSIPAILVCPFALLVVAAIRRVVVVARVFVIRHDRKRLVDSLLQ